MVIEPVASLLGQKRLVIVADGALQYVPFSALPISEPTAQGTKTQSATAATNVPTTLITNHELVSLPSASVLALQRRELANRKAAPLKLAVLADPVFDLEDSRVATELAKPNRNRKGPNTNTTASKAQTPSKNTPAQNENSTLVSALRDVGLNPDGALRRLSFSRTEAADISRLVPAKESLKALDFDASRATALSGELSKYQYVHFATHGILSLEHPELSGIALSMVDRKGQKQDGYLRLYEIYNLDLPAELVVLSACETGVGKQIRGEGLIALTRGFMYAGSKRVVASLWKVNDSATALMAQFYKEMFVNGKSPAAALQAAQKSIASQKRWRSPYYWAGFVLQGEWR
jgi:CHAT domain-containing protein